ncbi:MAG: hypothetical protein OEY36_01295 [Gammaproteobacteria bacterium]|nr:hypothetical protein [Gammaproteobacteria bacterium]
MKNKYHIIGIVGGAFTGALLGYLLKGNSGILFGVIYGIVFGEIVALSVGIRSQRGSDE